jgi:hypothetical protein
MSRYRAEKLSGGVGADVIDTGAEPMSEVIARCDAFGHARAIADAMNRRERFEDRIRTLEWGLGQIAAGDSGGGWGKIARAALKESAA